MRAQPAFDRLLAAFQQAVRVKTPEALQTLLVATRATEWRAFPEALGPLAQFGAPECLPTIANPGVDTDAALVVLQSIISRMEVIAEGPYRVEHDRSKNLLTYNDFLRRFIDHDRNVEFRQTEITSIKFPLKLAEVTQVDSKASPAVQLATVMIGAAIEAANNLAGLRSQRSGPAGHLAQKIGGARWPTQRRAPQRPSVILGRRGNTEEAKENVRPKRTADEPPSAP